MAIQEYCVDSDTADVTATTSTQYRAQTFTPSEDFTAVGAAIKVYQDAASVFNITMEIQATDGAGHPDNTAIATATIPDADIPEGAANVAWIYKAFSSSVDLTSGTKYALVLKISAGNLNWRSHGGWAAYAGGNYEYSNDSGANWSAGANDCMFEIHDSTPDPATDLLSDLQIYYPLNDNRGNSLVVDTSGNTNDGIAYDSSGMMDTKDLSVTGKMNNAFKFEDTNGEYIVCPNLPYFPSEDGDEVTIVEWFKMDHVNTAGQQRHITNLNSSSHGWMIGIYENYDGSDHTRIDLYFHDDTTKTFTASYSDSVGAYTWTNWHFLIFKLRNVSGTVYGDVYVDMCRRTGGSVAASSAFSHNDATYIATVLAHNTQFSDHNHDGIGIWNRSLTGLEMQYLYDGSGAGAGYEIEGSGSGALCDKEYSRKLVAVANDTIYYQSASDTMSELSGATGTLDTQESLDMFAADGKVFIVNQDIKKVVDFRNTKISTSDVGTNPTHRGNTLTGGTSGAEMIIDYADEIVNGNAGNIYGYRTTTATFANGETVTGTNDDGNAISFVLNANEISPPHYYDWTTYGNDTSNYGSLPDKATIAKWYWGRVVLSGNLQDSHQWYMSQVLNPWNFDYNASTDNELRAIAGGYAQAGKIPDIVIGIIPYKDDYCVFGCASSCYYLIGNPGGAGEIFELKGVGGLLSKFSWAWDSSGFLYLLTTKGILQIPPNFSTPMNLTAESWPEFIADLAYDNSTDRLTIGYDQMRNGLLISKTTIADGGNSCWWYDLNTKGIFPESYPDSMGFFSQYYSDGQGELIVGGFDGYMRNHDKTVKNDDGTLIDSYCSFGPIPLGNDPTHEGTIGPVDIILGGGGSTYADEVDSDNADYKIFVADTAAELIEKLINASGETPNFAGTMTGPGRRRGSKRTQSVRGVYGGVRIGNSTLGKNFIFECLNIGQQPKRRSK